MKKMHFNYLLVCTLTMNNYSHNNQINHIPKLLIYNTTHTCVCMRMHARMRARTQVMTRPSYVMVLAHQCVGVRMLEPHAALARTTCVV